jgi:NADPH-dependent 2,4-dienoyl-CoA reductase/sulfur reductase-like enzyme
MNDVIQAVSGVRVFEDKLAEPGTIDAPFADEFGPKLTDHSLESRSVWLVHGMGRLIGIDDHRAEGSQDVRHRRLPGAGTAGQPNEFQFAGMGDEEKFDAIVVGAGMAGISAAITLAKAGLQVVVLERGQKPGSKNVMGGIFYNHYLEEIVGEDWKLAPFERPIIEERRWMMTP